MDEDAPPTDSLYEFDNGEAVTSHSSATMNANPVYVSSSPPSSIMKKREIPGMDNSLASAPSGPSPQLALASNGSSPVFKITLFGFPASFQSSVISHFATISPIIYNSTNASGPGDTKLLSGPNWVTIGYDQEWAALRALRKNGEILGGSCMIGVKWADGTSSSLDSPSSAITNHYVTSSNKDPNQTSSQSVTFTPSSLGKPATILPASQAWLTNKPSNLHKSSMLSAASGKLGDLGKMDPAIFRQEEQKAAGGGWTGSLTNLIFGF